MARRVGRWTAALGGLLLVVALLGWLAYAVALPRYRPGLAEGERYGIDVSNHQRDIDWAAVAGDDVGLAYLKASEGATYEDERFTENWAGAREAGLEVGAYHFFTLCRSGEEQAANLLGRLAEVGANDTALLPVVDLELSGNCSDRPSADVVTERLRTFVDRVEAETGQRVVLYLLDDFAQVYPLPVDLADRDRWVRRLLRRPGGDWAWWQVSSRAHVNGVDGGVDLNVVAH
ncbi:lysozyme M1 (1,4-beta-N-acetylmuramidase) [Phycicoccus sp. CSK15P-2]|uniref:GH25 family lysozyme n=1 Tax=Phycicoccus sp. CSK15P-2 TaxID=2807627 RepID=UPI0019502A9F|nr:GH25 family lysozyme [Phycicoccus sp. CSK15P-2]MBM6402835.1 lysozyme M1 (1,4-beta-N-acetylmuramidase) [Phycicoccus sp. CSK15P-2]